MPMPEVVKKFTQLSHIESVFSAMMSDESIYEPGASMTAQPMIETPKQNESAAANPVEQAAAMPQASVPEALPEAVVATTEPAITDVAPEVAPAHAATETVADAAMATEEAMRKQVPPVEAATEPHPNAEALLPPPTPELPKPKQSSGEAVSIHDAKVENLILLPEVLTGAEKNLATHIGSMIDPMLEKNLLLSLSSNLEKGTTSLILTFEGDMVAANPAVLSEQVVAALHKVPAMHALFAQHHHTPVSHVHDGKLDVMIPHLTTAQYAHLVQSLAAGIEVSQAVQAPAHTHPAAEVAAQAQEVAAQAVGAAPVPHVAEVNHLGVANNNDIALTSMGAGR